MKTILSKIRDFRRDSGLSQAGRACFTVILCLLSGLGLFLAVTLVDSGRILEAITFLFLHPRLSLGGVLMLGLMVCCFTGLTHSLFFGTLISAVPVMIIALVNYFKFHITSTPLTVTDFALIGQMGHIAALNADALVLPRNGYVAIGAVLLWLVVLLFFSRPLRQRWRWSLCTAGGGALLFLTLFVLAANALFYRPIGLATTGRYSQDYININCDSLPMRLWRGVLQQDETTKNYSRQTMGEILRAVEDETADVPAAGTGAKPNIILILSESFFDVTELPGVTYDSDPLAEFHDLVAESVSGHFYTRTLGYGTAGIELEILTGINTRLLAYGDSLSSWDASRFEGVPTVPRLLRENGYYTAALHTFNDDIYHRGSFLPTVGFEDMFFSGDFAAIDPEAVAAADYWDYMSTKIAGGYYSDDYLADLLILLMEEKNRESPVFLYGISMENHAHHNGDKYESLDVSFSADLPDAAMGALGALVQGTADASRSLGKLTDHFRKSDEPVVIVFFGDHRPGMAAGDVDDTLYSLLGMCDTSTSQWTAENYQELYHTSYLIWANDAALLPGEPGEVRDSSSNYLGLELLRVSGVSMPLYWRLLQSMSASSLIYNEYFFVDPSGKLSIPFPEDMPAEEKNKFAHMTYILYDAYHRRYITEKLFDTDF